MGKPRRKNKDGKIIVLVGSNYENYDTSVGAEDD
jgi:hypothetical protein